MKFLDIIKKIVKIAPIVLAVWEQVEKLWKDSDGDSPKYQNQELKEIE